MDRKLTAANGEFIGFKEFRPGDYSSSPAKHPLVIFLHGIGEYGNGTTDLKKVNCCGIPKLIKGGHSMKFTWNGKSESFVVLSPQLDAKWVYWQSFYVNEMIKYAIANLRIDPNRIFLTGLSLGGGGTYAYPSESLSNASKLAGMVPVSGTCLVTNACNIANAKLPVYAVHSAIDRVVSYPCIVDAINRINNCGPAVKPLLFTYPNVTHGGVWIDAYLADHSHQNPNIYEWMLAQSRALPSNKKPVANAGTDQNISPSVGKSTLNASGSYDPDGKIVNYFWTKVSGPSGGTISNSTSPTANVSSLTTNGTYKYQLKVVDDRAEWSFDEISIQIGPGGSTNQSPIAKAGNDQTIVLPVNTVNLSGSASSDPDGSIASYAWTKISGPAATIATANTVNTAINNLVAGTYIFRLTITDNKGAAATDDVTITVKVAGTTNQNPIADAGTNKTITLPINTVTLSGSNSSDPDGSIAKYEWTKVSGPASTIASPSSESTAINNLVEGTYVYRLKVTDDKNATATDDVTVIVNPSTAANKNPIANAGANKTITLPTNTVTVDGSASSDPDGAISKYEWTKVSGPAATIASAAAASTSVNALVEGTYVFRLTVTDNKGATATDDVTVIVNPAPIVTNKNPVADAGTNKTITLPVSTVTLNGSASSDPDGTIAKYEWTKVSGPAAAIATATSVITAVNNLVEGTYVFRLKVTDDKNATATDDVTVIVNPVPPPANKNPIANAGANKTITLPVNTVTLSGTASSDPDGTISKYEWTKVSGPAATIATANTVSTAINNLIEGTYVFRLKVIDDKDATATDDVTITVKPEPIIPNEKPVADAGTNKTITLPVNTVTLNGSKSADPDGTISTYEWTKVSGPAATIATATTVNSAVNNLVEGTYVFRLKVADNDGALATDDVTVIVNPVPPPANQDPEAVAGANKTITLPVNTVTLDGSASSDPDGTISKYAWTKLSGPAASIVSSSSVTTAINNLIEGTYIFRLTVTDNKDATATDDVTVIVKPEPQTNNQDPIADAGTNKSITLPVNTVTLNGGASTDPDGTISKYEWTKISGPAATIATPGAVTTAINNLVEGTYVFQLKITDNGGASSTNQVTITVHPAILVSNLEPLADAGSNKSITLPANSVTLNGSGSSDPDGTISKYEWTKVSGPSADIASATAVTTTVDNLVEGTYMFRLTITDNQDATSTDEVTVIVNPVVLVSNQDPLADAGSNQNITLPVNSITLNGSGSSDPDGTISSYEWTKLSGPAATIATPGTVTTAVNNLVEGTYVFRLEITDNEGASSTDDVTIIVYPEGSVANQGPIADAGKNKSITLPENSATLDGSGSTDPDGSISKYEWTKVSGPSATLATPADASTDANDLSEGTYLFSLKITDNDGASSTDEVTIIVNPATPHSNIEPLADAGNNQSISLPVNSITLNGSGSSDPDGTLSTYEWIKVSGPAASVSTPDAVTSDVENLTEGTYVFQLKVTDENGASAIDEVTVIVYPEGAISNQSPLADAGKNRSITLPVNHVTLNGENSSDPDGSIVKYEWTEMSGPSATIETPGSSISEVNELTEGTYLFRLQVTDNKGATSTDEVTVIVNPVGQVSNQDPKADAGEDFTITLPLNAKGLNGSGSSDSDGSIVSYFWYQTDGPDVTIDNPDSANSTIRIIKRGTYSFKLEVTDNSGASSFDDVIINVQMFGIPDSSITKNESDDVKVNVFPNPARNSLLVRLNDKDLGKTRLTVYDSRGLIFQLMEKEKMGAAFREELHIMKLKPGLYYLEVILPNNKTIISKFIKLP